MVGEGASAAAGSIAAAAARCARAVRAKWYTKYQTITTLMTSAATLITVWWNGSITRKYNSMGMPVDVMITVRYSAQRFLKNSPSPSVENSKV